MRLFTYYALHAFKNQLKKLFKTWVLIFILVCVGMGIGIGLFAAGLEEAAQGDSVEASVPEEQEQTLADIIGIESDDIIELIAGGLVLGIFVLMAFGADKNGSRIFLPADVNLLFASPMKPQSVLMFRLTTRLGVAVLGCVYFLLQLPNLILNVGLSLWASLAMIAAFGLTVMLATLVQVLLYTLSSTYPGVKRFLRPVLYALLACVAAGYLLYHRQSGSGALKAAVDFFNAPASRCIPLWGWLKGFCMFAVEGNGLGAALCFAGILLAGGLLIFFIWRIKADFYEDAMAKSEEIAELLERAQSEKSNGIVFKRKKDRSEKLRRDGFRHGSGANVFFFKTMYNRFRFAHFGFFTKTMEFYLAAAVGTAVICRFAAETASFTPVALTLAGLAFFRSLGNPLEQDTKMDYFVLIPESTWAKLFWSLMGGTANCLLDVLPAVIAGALLMGANPAAALVWVPFILSVDFYATNVGTFIDLSVPVSAGKTVKQIVQIMFVYFGLLPDIVIISIGLVFGHAAVSIILSAAVNIGLGFLFFALSPLFLDPQGGRRPKREVSSFNGDLRAARKQFSRLGLGVFAILAIGSVLQLAAAVLAGWLVPSENGPAWLIWLCTFGPLYAIAVPIGLLIIRKAPAAPMEKHSFSPGRIIVIGIICIFMMYAGNIFGVIVTSLLQSLFGHEALNPIMSYATDENIWMKILFMVILAPVIEEFIFRKQLIDRMNVYGQRLAVVVSALIFGLFHGNLSQLFYAFALGLVFGSVYLKTGRLRYSIGLHMFINFIGSVLGPWLLGSVDFAALDTVELTAGADLAAVFSPQLIAYLAYVALLLGLALAGLVLLCVKSRKISFAPAACELPKRLKFKTVYLNIGMLLLLVFCFASIALTFVV